MLTEIRKSGRFKEREEQKNEIIMNALSRLDGLEKMIKKLENNVYAQTNVKQLVIVEDPIIEDPIIEDPIIEDIVIEDHHGMTREAANE